MIKMNFVPRLSNLASFWHFSRTTGSLPSDSPATGHSSLATRHFQYVAGRTIPADKSIRSSPLAAAHPLTILSWSEALNASGFRRACPSAPGRNACPLTPPVRHRPMIRRAMVDLQAIAIYRFPASISYRSGGWSSIRTRTGSWGWSRPRHPKRAEYSPAARAGSFVVSGETSGSSNGRP